MLKVERVSKSFPTRDGRLNVLRETSFTADRGESLAITGPSGSGKSTLLNILGTLEPPSSGRVELAGVDALALPPRGLAEFRNRHIGFIFQEHHLLGQCDALENVLVPTLAAAGPRRDQRALDLLARVGLQARLHHAPGELSGGERQRVAISRALINSPTLLLADEPTGNLDRQAADTVADLLFELQRSEAFILVLVTHSERLAARFSRRYELADGVLSAS